MSGLLASSNFNPKKAYLRSSEVNIAFPCKNCRVAVTSGMTLGGDSNRELIGEKSTISLPRHPGLALGIKYELTSYKWCPKGTQVPSKLYQKVTNIRQMSCIRGGYMKNSLSSR